MPFDGIPVTSPEIEVLEKVYDLIKRVGWCQGSYIDYAKNTTYPTAYCLMGAYEEAQKTFKVPQERFIDLIGFDKDEYVVDWNDNNERTKRGVLRKLTNAINKEKKKLLDRALDHGREATS